MNIACFILRRSSFVRFGRWACAVGLAAGLAGTALRAVTFTQTLAMPGYTTGTTMTTQSNPTLGTFDFSAAPYGTFATVNSISITLALYDLQTMPTGGQQKLDFNNISLTLGGTSTGLLLNGYARNVGSTVTTTAVPTNSSAIITALVTNGGFLTFGLLDATTNPTNTFDYFGGIASLSLDIAAITPVPFSPSTSLGFAIVAGIGLVRSWPKLKRRFAGRV